METYKMIRLRLAQVELPGVLFRAEVEETSKGPRLKNLQKTPRSYFPADTDPAYDFNWSKLVVPDRSCRASAQPGHDVQIMRVTHDTAPGWESHRGVLFVEVQHVEHLCIACVEKTMREWLEHAPNHTCAECGYDSSRRVVTVAVPREELSSYGVEGGRAYVFLEDIAFRFVAEQRGYQEFAQEVARALEADHANYHRSEMERRQREQEARAAVVRWADAHWPTNEVLSELAEYECWNGCGTAYLRAMLRPNRTVSVWAYDPFEEGFVGEALGVDADGQFTLGLEDFNLDPEANCLRNKNTDPGFITIYPEGKIEVEAWCCPAL